MAKEEKKKEQSFATTDLRQFVKWKVGDCSTCDNKNETICEHGHCWSCQCKHYCWLD